MAHKHYCDVTGHEWECDDPTCYCVCGELIADGDHSLCAIELRPCEAHFDGLKEGEVIGGVPIAIPADADEKAERAFSQLETYEAACFWCGHGYDEYSRKAEDEHFANNCPGAPEELRQNAKRRLLGDNE